VDAIVKTTIKDIAKVTGLSLGTVSEALKGKHRVAAKTRELVQKVAKELNYIPNNLGRALQSQRSSLLGYFLIDITKSFFVDILQEITFAATLEDFAILFQTPEKSSTSEIDKIELFLKKSAEGIITSGCEPATWKYLLSLKNSGIPVVASSCYSPYADIPSVTTDDYLGGQLAAEYLVGLGHRNMVYFNPSRSSSHRDEGFNATLTKFGMPPLNICTSLDDLAFHCTREPGKRVTAVFAYCDTAGLEAMRLVQGMGLNVPNEVSIIGFDDDAVSALQEINMTSLAHPKKLIGKNTVKNILKQINGEKADSVLMAPTLKVRGSTAAAPLPN
jgi:DNA-binding LacI/PurR family transcriptional regulator